MRTSENLISHEFVGLDTEIVDSSNPQIIGLNGRIENETKSMFTINTENGTRTIAKSTSSWKFSVDNNDVIVEGSKIAKRPFDRIGGKA